MADSTHTAFNDHMPYSIDLAALDADHAHIYSPNPVQGPMQCVLSDDVDGPTDFTIDMDLWMRDSLCHRPKGLSFREQQDELVSDEHDSKGHFQKHTTEGTSYENDFQSLLLSRKFSQYVPDDSCETGQAHPVAQADILDAINRPVDEIRDSIGCDHTGTRRCVQVPDMVTMTPQFGDRCCHEPNLQDFARKTSASRTFGQRPDKCATVYDSDHGDRDKDATIHSQDGTTSSAAVLCTAPAQRHDLADMFDIRSEQPATASRERAQGLKKNAGGLIIENSSSMMPQRLGPSPNSDEADTALLACQSKKSIHQPSSDTAAIIGAAHGSPQYAGGDERSKRASERNVSCSHCTQASSEMQSNLRCTGVAVDLRSMNAHVKALQLQLAMSVQQIVDLRERLAMYESTQSLFEDRIAAAVQRHDRYWRERVEVLIHERQHMSKALMQAWAENDVGASSPQMYEYKYGALDPGDCRLPQ